MSASARPKLAASNGLCACARTRGRLVPLFPRLGKWRISRGQFPALVEPVEGTDGPFDIDTESRSGPTVLRAIALPSSACAPRGWGARARREWHRARPGRLAHFGVRTRNEGAPYGEPTAKNNNSLVSGSAPWRGSAPMPDPAILLGAWLAADTNARPFTSCRRVQRSWRRRAWHRTGATSVVPTCRATRTRRTVPGTLPPRA